MFVAMTTASMLDSRSSSKSRNPLRVGYCRVILLNFFGSRSQQADNSHRSLFASTRARFGPQYPKPTRPTLTISISPFFVSLPAGNESFSAAALFRAPARKNRRYREQKDFYVEPETGPLSVINVHSDHLLKTDPASCRSLPPACNPRHCPKPLVMGLVVQDHLVEKRGTWSDQAHLSP